MDLKSHISVKYKNCSHFSKKVGLNQSLIRSYILGDKLPGIRSIEKIEKVTSGAVKGEDLLLYWLHIQRQKRKEKATAEGRHE
jgi:hypothetical protein